MTTNVAGLAAPQQEKRFDIRRQLGSGAMGVVFLAQDLKRGLPVALKTLRRFDPAELYRLKREFRSLADVAHPNLATLYELVLEQGQWYLSMEYVDGVDFKSHVRPGAS